MKVEKKSELIGRGGVYRRPVVGTEFLGESAPSTFLTLNAETVFCSLKSQGP